MDPINFKKKKKKIPNITLDDVIEPVQVLVKTVVVLMVGSEPARSCASTILGKSHLLSFLVSTEQNIQNYLSWIPNQLKQATTMRTPARIRK
jgi:hypothetical protein